MKFWHQSTTDLTILKNYRDSIIQHGKRVLPEATIEPHGLIPGMFADFGSHESMKRPYTADLVDNLFCEAAMAAEREGFDAFVIGCNLDCGLRKARSMVNIPVVGVTEASMHAACFLGNKFAFITMDKFMQHHISAEVDRCGLTGKLACIHILEEPILKYTNAARRQQSASEEWDEEGNAKIAKEIFLNACRQAIDKGAEVLIPGEGILNEYIYDAKLTECDGMAILDANAALWNTATMLANLRSKSNIITSRGFEYLNPTDAMRKQLRGFFNQKDMRSSDFS